MPRLIAAMLAATALLAAPAHAQNYPTRPIRMLVPFSPGGNVDITARTVAPGLAQALGQQVLVDNRPGAGGSIGTDAVAKAVPDGHTIMMASSSVMVNGPAVYPKLPYDIERDLAPVGRVAVVPLALVVHPSVPAKTTRELIAVAKAQDGNMLMANAGVGTTNHLIAELFLIRSGVRMTLVPYKGSGPALIDLIAGHVFAHVDQVSSALPYIRAGRIRPIAVTTAQRASLLPDVPTLAESGLPGFDASTVTGILAPAKVPQNIIAKLNGALNKVLADPAVKKKFASLGAEVQPSTPAELGKFIHDDLAIWKDVVRKAGIKVEL
jgi:tripartite-type tricarboxylate transporter receptor subunit TctC